MKILNILKRELTLLLLLIAFNVFVLSNSSFIVSQVYTTFFLVCIPGFVLRDFLRIYTKHFWEFLLIIVGLSISFLLFTGLAANFFLPLFSISQPLSQLPLLYFFDVVLITCMFANMFSPPIPLPFKKTEISVPDVLFGGLSFCLPFLAIFGAISLNNGGSNMLTMILLSLIMLIVLGLVIFEKRTHEYIYYSFIFLASISLLLMLSLRSWYISGSDINEEFRIFQITKNNGFWDPAIPHAYNACLSITILPTIFSLFTNINDHYIFKLVVQLLFGLAPVALFSLYRNYTNKIVAFFGVFYIIAQPFFIQPMTSLIRQEIAMFFLFLILSVIFNKSLKKSSANLLFIVFGLSMIVSHYSTSYTIMGLFTASFIIILFFNLFKIHSLIKKIVSNIKRLDFTIHLSHNIQFLPLLILLSFTYFWYFQFTLTSDNLTTLIHTTLNKFQNILTLNIENDEAKKSLAVFTPNDSNTIENINKYALIKSESFSKNDIEKYPIEFDDNNLHPVPPITVRPLYVNSINDFFLYFLNIIKTVTKVIVFVGAVYLILRHLHKDRVDNEYIILNTLGISLVTLVIVQPTIGNAYNLSRIYLQVLSTAALGGILFFINIIPFIAIKVKYIITAVMLCCMFFLFSGLSSQFIGGVSYLHLNNYGDDYDKFYTHTQEVYSAQWLAKHYKQDDFIFADNISNLRLQSFARINTAIPVIIPSAMYKNSYIYLRYANLERSRTDASLGGLSLTYSFPMNFLNENKNIIYNNGKSVVYR